MAAIKAVIADDEAPLREHLKSLLATLWPELQIVGMAGNGAEALALMREHEPDVTFLDIKMPLLSGLQVAASYGDSSHVVFITAYDEYAVEAFEHAAVDYLLKPVEATRLAETVVRLQKRLASRHGPSPEWTRLVQQLAQGLPDKPAAGYLSWLRASRLDATYLIPAEDVCYFKSDDKYTTVVTRDDKLLIRKSISALEAELDPDKFWRIHRGLIVNLASIAVARKTLNGGYTLQLKDHDEVLPVSRQYAHRFRQM
jgi:DNA-binding LytR/AlgR family response regulator